MSRITYLTNIDFGAGELAHLPDVLVGLGVARPLIVSDNGIRAAGLLDRLTALLPAGTPTFLEVPTNPSEAAILAALEAYRAAACDGVVAFGGGSPIDLAKAVALLATHDGKLADFAAIYGGLGRITPAVAPVVAIPTTAGTGSEVGRAALVTLADGHKVGLISPHLIPRHAICDPALTQGLPPRLTAATGFDAMSHCIETYLSPRDNPPAEAIALDGFGRIWRALDRAVADGADIAARTEMMMGSLEGGLTFQKGLGAVHALSHALGGTPGLALHHGMLNAIFLPPVLRFNAAAVPQKIARLKEVAGLAAGADLAEAIEGRVAALGLPTRLSQLGVSASHEGQTASWALADHSHATNPVQPSEDEYRALFRAVL
jgi:alcohol dehydrogenase class IV